MIRERTQEACMSEAPILAGVTSIPDIDTAGDFEKKHTPFVTCERDESGVRVSVRVGHWVGHPNTPDHFIEWIAIHAGGVPVVRFDLSAVASSPNVSCVLDVDPGTSLTALESCNLHGVWAREFVTP
jgi:superoxide reductase